MSTPGSSTSVPRRRRLARWLVLLAVSLLPVAAVLAGRAIIHSHERDEGLRLAAAGRIAEAEPLLVQALARNGGDAEVLAALARVKLAGPDHVAAEDYLNRWAEQKPGEAAPYRLRMDLRRRIAQGKWSAADRLRSLEEAIADGRRVLELEPGLDSVRREVAEMLLQAGRFGEAEVECRRCLEAKPDEPALLELLAAALHAQGKRSEAEPVVDRLLRDPTPRPRALLLRAILHHESNRPDLAVPVLRQALSLEQCPRKDCLYRLGLALAATGRDGEARKVLADLDLIGLQEAIANDNFPETPAMKVQMAEAMLAAGRAEDARTRLEGVLGGNPDFAPAHRVLARYYDLAGQPDRAAEHRRKSAGGMK